MKTLSRRRDQNEILQRLANVSPGAAPRWGRMNSRQMICHLSDSFRASLGEKHTASAANWFTRSIYKWVALWSPMPWPHGIKTRPEMDQQIGGTPPAEFAADIVDLRRLFIAFCSLPRGFHPHAMLGQLSKAERMRHAYLHMDHHLRQFGA